MAELSPMMKQYFEIKNKNPDVILFYRLGDFYEMFFDDAKLASKELDLILTGRDCGLEERAPMCGVPYHSCEEYIAKLISKGYKVAICEQLEDPALTKGIVKRGITRVITPGTVMESSLLDAGQNNYICSLYTLEKKCGAAFCDVSTGKLLTTEVSGNNYTKSLLREIFTYSPTEIICNTLTTENKELCKELLDKLNIRPHTLSEDRFESVNDNFGRFFKDIDFENSEFANCVCAAAAVSGLMEYLKITQMNGLERIAAPKFYHGEQFMQIDYSTRKNLELFSVVQTGKTEGSLLWVIDKTNTAMGKRLLRSWLERPLLACNTIINRQSSISELIDNLPLRMDLGDALSPICDIQRIMTKVSYGSVKPKELYALGESFEKIPALKELLKDCRSVLLRDCYKNTDDLADLKDMILTAISKDAGLLVKEGGIFADGYNKEIDDLRLIINDSATVLAKIEAREKERTGIPKLKIGYNKVFGYYIEISNMYKELAPETYIRKQTLTGCERYITEELKSLEGTILGAKERCCKLEYDLYIQFVEQIASHLARIEQTARQISVTDALLSLANVAAENNYCRPEINNSGRIILKESRHPVAEQILKTTPFVPNDVYLDTNDNRTNIITGPNMAGKSTYMRQAALITIMAQAGSYVPCESAEIGIVDAVFTRIGAYDDLTTGQSTFMVEMNEVANIVKSATKNSLLIFDEIGRGTSTYDGMSIARAVIEYVTNKKVLGAKTLFATHYHELTEMENTLDGVKNYNIAVKKRGFDITFLRRIVPGGADESYGIEVAKLAGVPQPIILRAKEILSELEKGEKISFSQSSAQNKSNKQAENIQFEFESGIGSEIIDRLKTIDANTLTPIEALRVLYELCQQAKDTV
ncbi:MAG: DNA mismatch repair protein MutS [Clostridiales bacterium]|nr:DNA mismatch repair protein MutS [Clostridiales bacterium]